MAFIKITKYLLFKYIIKEIKRNYIFYRLKPRNNIYFMNSFKWVKIVTDIVADLVHRLESYRCSAKQLLQLQFSTTK